MPAKAKSGRSSPSANQCVTLGAVSVHSQNEVAGTRQRQRGSSQGCHHALFTLRILVTGLPPACGEGRPQRIGSISRTPSRPARTTGAIWSGKIAGSGGWLPVRSPSTRINRRASSCDLV